MEPKVDNFVAICVEDTGKGPHISIDSEVRDTTFTRLGQLWGTMLVEVQTQIRETAARLSATQLVDFLEGVRSMKGTPSVTEEGGVNVLMVRGPDKEDRPI